MLVGSREVEPCRVSARIHCPASQFEGGFAIRNGLPDGLVGVESGAALFDIGEFHRLAQPDGTGIGLFLTGDHLEQGGLPGAVGADDADDTAGRQGEGHVLYQEPIAVGFAHPVRLDHHFSQPRSGRNINLELLGLLLVVLSQQCLVSVDARLGLGMAPLGRHPDPLELALQGFLTFGFALFLLLQAGSLLFKPGRVIAFPRNPVTPVQLENPASNVIKEVAVVGDGNHRPGIALQVVFEPGDRFGIEVVGGLIQEQYVRRLQQEAAERHPPLFATGKLPHGGIAGWAAKSIHGHFQPRIQIPGIKSIELFLDFPLARDQPIHLVVSHRFCKGLVDSVKFVQQIDNALNPLLDNFAHRLGFIQYRFLLKKTDGVAGREDRFTVEVLVHARQDAQQGAFAGAVEAQHADLGAVEIGKVDILEDWPLIVILADADHGIDDFVRFNAHAFIILSQSCIDVAAPTCRSDSARYPMRQAHWMVA